MSHSAVGAQMATAPPAPGATIDRGAKVQHPRIGDDTYGNAVPMETTKRFPQGLGNPAEHGISTFPQVILVANVRRKGENMTDRNFNKVLPMYPV
jgi:hypothetical protein